MEELKIGDIIKDRYTLRRFLGNGSFGEVWLAHDVLLGHDVALKIYLSLDPSGIEEFQREYTNTIDFTSPYLLKPDYIDVYGRRPFLVMKYCEKGASSKFIGNITENQLWHFIEDVANGLVILHNQSDPIVHQDIKPDNILIDTNDRFLITDFGISKRLRATMRKQSKRDISSGAMPYMAPERFESKPKLTTASDIWSLGASIYELATGELPFSGFGGSMQRNGADMPSLPSKYSSGLNDIMQRCLNPDATYRPNAIELSKWATSKVVPQTKSANIHNPIAKQAPTVIEQQTRTTVKSSSHLPAYIIFAILAILAVIVFCFREASNSENSIGGTTQVTQIDTVSESINTIPQLTAKQLVLKSNSVTQNGQNVHFYKGAFYYKNDIYPVMLAFIVSGNQIQRVVYENVTYGAKITMSYQVQGDEIRLCGKDGNNDFIMMLSAGNDARLLGTAIDGNKSMTVRLMPTDESFEYVGKENTSDQYDIAIIAKAFISKYSNGLAPWNCLNGTAAKRLSNDLEEDNSAGGIFMVPFSAPLTSGGKPLVANQLDAAINWDIYLRGPHAGASTIMFTAIPQFVDLVEIAKLIAKRFNAIYLKRYDSEYGRDCVFLYTVNNMRLAISCSFGAHGGTIEAVLGEPNSVNEYANNCM